MCIICIDLMAKRMSTYDASLAVVEMKSLIGVEHAAQVGAAIRQLDVEKKKKEEEEAEVIPAAPKSKDILDDEFVIPYL